MKYKALKDEYASIVKSNKGKKRTDWQPLPPVPVLHKTIMNDFTPEALMRNHDANRRGVAVVVDEIMGLFNTVNRYNNNPFIQQLLSAHSGQPIDVSRCNLDCPFRINNPCIQIAGTIQTGVVHELYDIGFKKNGLLDRFLFSFPQDMKIPPWQKEDGLDASVIDRPFRIWKGIIEKALSIDFVEEQPNILDLSNDAMQIFFDWRNDACEQINAISDERLIDTRFAKVPLNTARLALIFQIFRWACGESHKNFIDTESVNSAICMSDYFENSYNRLVEIVADDAIEPVRRQWLDLMGSPFTTSDAVKAGEALGMSKRSVMYMLADFHAKGILNRTRKGEYEKLR